MLVYEAAKWKPMDDTPDGVESRISEGPPLSVSLVRLDMPGVSGRGALWVDAEGG